MAISVPSFTIPFLPPIRFDSRYLHHNERLPGFTGIEAGTSSVLAGRYTLYQIAKARTDSHNISGPQHDTPSRGAADSPTASIYPISYPGKPSPTPAYVKLDTGNIFLLDFGSGGSRDVKWFAPSPLSLASCSRNSVEPTIKDVST